MACMEHVCNHSRCDWCHFDNNPRTTCPEHPGETSHFFDESDDDREPPDEEDDDES